MVNHFSKGCKRYVVFGFAALLYSSKDAAPAFCTNRFSTIQPKGNRLSTTMCRIPRSFWGSEPPEPVVEEAPPTSSTPMLALVVCLFCCGLVAMKMESSTTPMSPKAELDAVTRKPVVNALSRAQDFLKSQTGNAPMDTNRLAKQFHETIDGTWMDKAKSQSNSNQGFFGHMTDPWNDAWGSNSRYHSSADSSKDGFGPMQFVAPLLAVGVAAAAKTMHESTNDEYSEDDQDVMVPSPTMPAPRPSPNSDVQARSAPRPLPQAAPMAMESQHRGFDDMVGDLYESIENDATAIRRRALQEFDSQAQAPMRMPPRARKSYAHDEMEEQLEELEQA